MASNKVSKAPSGAGILSVAPQPVTGIGATTSMQPLGRSMPQLAGLTGSKVEAVKCVQELAAKMGFRQDPEFSPIINMFPGQLLPDVTLQPKPAKTLFLRLDVLGREVDEHGNVVNIAKSDNLSTLKRSGLVPGVAMVHSLVALLPNPFPERHWNQACELAPIFNELVDHVSLDGKFLQDTLSRTKKVDVFTSRLLDIHSRMLEIGKKEKGAMTSMEVCEGLALYKLKTKKWHIQGIYALRRDMLYA